MLHGRCAYCVRKLQQIIVCCNDCKNVNLCIFCFSHGVEAGHHRKTHRYSVKYVNINEEGSCIINGWSDVDELELLCAVEQYGLGNWEDIADKVQNHTPQECQEHYMRFYLQGSSSSTLCSLSHHTKPINDHTTPQTSLPLTHEKPVSLEPVEQQLLGYMVMRDDFERDYDNDAESLLTRLNVHSDCDDLENALHVAHVNIYTQRLQERQKRKEIGRSHGLISRISAYLTFKKPKRKPQQQIKVERCKVTSRKRKLTPQASPSSPPAGSWLAAPFVLQSFGPTRGIPVVAPGVMAMTQETILTATAENEEYDAFNISDKLKPFLRYFTPAQANQFLSNLHREEVLKHEIKFLFNTLQKCVNRSSNSSRVSSPLKVRPPELWSHVYVKAPPNTEPLHPLLVGLPAFGVLRPSASGVGTPASNATTSARCITAALRSAGGAAAVDGSTTRGGRSRVAAATAQTQQLGKRKRRKYGSSRPWYARQSSYYHRYHRQRK